MPLSGILSPQLNCVFNFGIRVRELTRRSFRFAVLMFRAQPKPISWMLQSCRQVVYGSTNVSNILRASGSKMFGLSGLERKQLWLPSPSSKNLLTTNFEGARKFFEERTKERNIQRQPSASRPRRRPKSGKSPQ